jgi:hypothetical protein
MSRNLSRRPAVVEVATSHSEISPVPVWEEPFRRLGLLGLATIAPVLVGALVTEEPLLLIGAHGTAKTLLLTRIAAALGLECRHYNASLLNFDDLVGFPLPGAAGDLRYIGTPASIWGAGAVIFDEISRCRPDIQNKLFPIIHERRAQGLLLEGLRYRWSATRTPRSFFTSARMGIRVYEIRSIQVTLRRFAPLLETYLPLSTRSSFRQTGLVRVTTHAQAVTW